MTLEGLSFEKVIYQAGAYTVARYKTTDGRKITAAGSDLPVSPASVITITGDWVNSRYGLQVKVTGWAEEKPARTDAAGMIEYLAAAGLPRVGRKTAERIVEKFGERTYEVIEKEPERLASIKGITKDAAEKIHAEFLTQEAARAIYTWLGRMGMPAGWASKIRKSERELAYYQEHPYRLCGLPGIGFGLVDAAIRSAGIPYDREERATYGTMAAMENIMSYGHDWATPSQLMTAARRMLGTKEETIKEAIQTLVTRGLLVYRHGAIYTARGYAAEAETAKRLACIARARARQEAEKEKTAEATERAQRALGITLDAEQTAAVERALENPVTIITGGPGTGKTTIIKVLLESVRELWPDAEAALMAPTGRAAARMREATGKAASTIHAALGIYDDGGEAGTEITADLVIVDECSMISQGLMHALTEAVTPGTRLVLIGDADQLPSVESGRAFNDILGAGCITTARLTRNHRQGEGSGIVENARRVNAGNGALEYDESTRLIEAAGAEKAAEEIEKIVRALLAGGMDPESIQILTPLREKTAVGAVELNRKLQEAFNPARRGKQEVKQGRTIWRVGDRVMHLKNESASGLSNGDVGRITGIDAENKTITAEYAGHSRTYTLTEAPETLRHSWASTVHKAQGSEYKIVIMALVPECGHMRQRRLLYTGLTRAQKRAYLVGDRSSIATAAENTGSARQSYFGALLKRAMAA